jgi:hypothetical protein
VSWASDLHCPRRAPGASGFDVDGRPALLDRSTGSLHVLNDVGAAIWSRLDGSYTVGSLVAELSEESGAEPARVAHDVRGFLSELGRLGLLEGSSAAGNVEPVRTSPGRDSWSIDTAWVDWYTGQVVAALRRNGVDAIVLKGPAISRWLYSDAPGERGYIDADVLVAERDLSAAAAVLSELGFRHEDRRGMERIALWATSWSRDADGAVVDLHRTLHGCEHSRVDPWPILSATAVEEEVGGICVALASIPARTLQIVLVSPNDRPWRQWNDLKRALEQVPIEGWRDAAAVADALGVERLFGYRLSESPAGARCARRLGLKTAPRWWLYGDADPLLRWIVLLATVPSWAARLRLARHLIAPQVTYVRSRDPEAAKRGVAAAYGAWAVHVLRLVPGAIATLLRAVVRRRRRR